MEVGSHARKLEKIIMKLTKKKIVTIVSILMLVTIMLVNLQSSVVAQDETSTPENWIELITQTPGGAYREPPGETDYPVKCSPGYVPSMTGYSEGPGPATNNVLWRSRVPLTDWQIILAHNGKIFASSGVDNCLYALDELTGEVIWKRPNSSLVRWAVLDDNYIFTTEGPGGNQYPAAISQNSGELDWTATIPGTVYGFAPYGEVFWDGSAIFTYDSGRSPGNTSCYSVTNGGSIRHMWTNDTVQGRLGYADGRLYGVVEYNRWVSCVDASTGDLIWNFTGTGDPEEMFYPSPTLAYGNVYLGTENDGSLELTDNVVCLDAETGDYKWTYETGEYFVQSMSAAYGNVYINGGERNSVHCVDGETGEKKWEYNAPGFVDYYEIAIADGKLYFPSAALAVTGFPAAGTFPSLANCIDAMTGEPIWSYQVDTSASAPAIIVDGKYVFHSYSDYIWCFGKGPTTTNIEVASTSLTLGQSALISGSVTDMSPFSQQHPELQSPVVAEVPIVLSYVNAGTWTDFATVNTDSAGTFMYNLTPSSIGGYTVVARFEGNDAYDWSSAQKVVSVSPAPEPEAYPEAPEYTTIELAILTAVAISIVIGAVSFYILRKRK